MLNFNAIVDLLDGSIPLTENPESQIKSLLGIKRTKDYKNFIKKTSALAGKYPIEAEFKTFLQKELKEQIVNFANEVLRLKSQYISMLDFEQNADELVKAKFLQFTELASVVSSFGELKPKEVKVKLTKFLGGTEVAQNTAAKFLAVYHSGVQLKNARPENQEKLQKRLIKSVNEYLTGSLEVTDSSAGYVLEMINGPVFALNGITVAQEAIDALKVETPLDKQAQALDEESIPGVQMMVIPDYPNKESFVSSVRNNLALFQSSQASKFEEDKEQQDLLQKITTKTQEIHLLEQQVEDIFSSNCEGFEANALATYRHFFRSFNEVGAKVVRVADEEKDQEKQSVKDRDHEHSFLRVFKAATISDLFADVDADEIEDHAKAAYVFFGDDLDRLENFLTEYKSARSPYHDAFYHELPELDGRVALNVWRDFIKQNSDNPEIIKALIFNFSGVVEMQKILHIGKDDEVTIPSGEELLGAIEKLHYYKYADANPELAKVYQTYAISERVFNDTLRVINKFALKVEDTIPDVVIDVAREIDEIKGQDLYFVKLPVANYRGFILGHITNCCQSIGGHSEKLVIDGMTRQNNSFYVLVKAGQDGFNPNAIDWNHFEENGNQILGQGYVWRAEDGALVFDSWENRSTKHNSIMLPVLQKFGEKLEATVDRVVVGAGGKTPAEIKKSTPKGLRSSMIEGVEYFDSRIQHEVFVSSSLQEVRSFVGKVFSINNTLFIKSGCSVEFFKQHIDVFLERMPYINVFLERMPYEVKSFDKLELVKKMFYCADACMKEGVQNSEEIGAVFESFDLLKRFQGNIVKAYNMLIAQDAEKVKALAQMCCDQFKGYEFEALKVLVDQDVEKIKAIDMVRFRVFQGQALEALKVLVVQDVERIEALGMFSFSSFEGQEFEALEVLAVQDVERIEALGMFSFSSFEGKALEALEVLAVQDVERIEALGMFSFSSFEGKALEALKVLAVQDVERINAFKQFSFRVFEGQEFEALEVLAVQDVERINAFKQFSFRVFEGQEFEALKVLVDQDAEKIKVLEIKALGMFSVRVFQGQKLEALKVFAAHDVEKIEALSECQFSQFKWKDVEALKVFAAHDVEKVKALAKMRFDQFECNEFKALEVLAVQDVEKIEALSEFQFSSFDTKYLVFRVLVDQDVEKIEALSECQFSQFKWQHLEALKVFAAQDVKKINALKVFSFSSFEGQELEALKVFAAQDVRKINALKVFSFSSFEGQELEALKVLVDQDVEKIEAVLKIYSSFIEFFQDKLLMLKTLVECEDASKVKALATISVGFLKEQGENVDEILQMLSYCDTSKIQAVSNILNDFSWHFPFIDYSSNISDEEEEDYFPIPGVSIDEEDRLSMSSWVSDDEGPLATPSISGDRKCLSAISRVDYSMFGRDALDALKILIRCNDEDKINAVADFPFKDFECYPFTVLQYLMTDRVVVNNGSLCLAEGCSFELDDFMDADDRQKLNDLLKPIDASSKLVSDVSLHEGAGNLDDCDFLLGSFMLNLLEEA